MSLHGNFYNDNWKRLYNDLIKDDFKDIELMITQVNGIKNTNERKI